MMRVICLLTILAASCAPAATEVPASPGQPVATATSADDDGTYLERIDPLGGQWQVDRLGAEDFERFKGWVNFSAGGFLNHGAGCSGGYPAFYRLAGERLAVTRREAVRIGKCDSDAAASSEKRLADFLDKAVAWNKPDGRTLVLSTKDGVRALLKRPIKPEPELAGRWIIETTGGKPLITERRPATLTIASGSIGAHADCNSFGAPFTVPAPGRIVLSQQLVGTERGCDPEDDAEDALLARAMSSATRYRLEAGRLIFTGGPGMVLRRPPPPNRQLPGEYRACGDTLLGAYHEGPITLTIDERVIRDNAGCTATYRRQGPRLVLWLDGSQACARPVPPHVPGEPVAVGGPISTLAVTRPDGFAFDEQGRLILRTNRGLLSMCRKGSPPPFGS